MAHSVLGLLIGHELTLSIPAKVAAARQSDFNRALTQPSRSEVIKALFAFSGVELIEYDSAVIGHDKKGTTLTVRSRHWALGQPT